MRNVNLTYLAVSLRPVSTLQVRSHVFFQSIQGNDRHHLGRHRSFLQIPRSLAGIGQPATVKYTHGECMLRLALRRALARFVPSAISFGKDDSSADPFSSRQ